MIIIVITHTLIAVHAHCGCHGHTHRLSQTHEKNKLGQTFFSPGTGIELETSTWQPSILDVRPRRQLVPEAYNRYRAAIAKNLSTKLTYRVFCASYDILPYYALLKRKNGKFFRNFCGHGYNSRNSRKFYLDRMNNNETAYRTNIHLYTCMYRFYDSIIVSLSGCLILTLSNKICKYILSCHAYCVLIVRTQLYLYIPLIREK